MSRKKLCPECKTFYLKAIPDDVYDIWIDKQSEEKKKRRTGRNAIEDMIYMISREWLKFKSVGAVIESDNLKMTIGRKITPEERTYIINELNKRIA